MKKIIFNLKLYLAIIILIGMILLTSSVFAENDSHKPITVKLINLVEKNPDIFLELVITETKKQEAVSTTNNNQMYPGYYPNNPYYYPYPNTFYYQNPYNYNYSTK